MEKNIKLNYLYNLIYQAFALLTPLVTTPYVSRVLGSSGLGQYSFTYSIVSYFTLFAAMGFGIYAQREVAKIQGEKKEQSLLFWEILLARAISVLISFFLYILICVLNIFDYRYHNLFLIQIVNIVAVAFDITFFFQGNEEFKTIAFRNIIIKIMGVVAIFAFVKSVDDVLAYALCQSCIILLSNISLWSRLPQYLVKVSCKEIKFYHHIKPALGLFVPTIAVYVYTMLDKTLLGILVKGSYIKQMQDGTSIIINYADEENGFYEQAEKLIKMASTVITSLGVVMTPRNANIYASGEIKLFSKNVNKSLQFVGYIGIPMMFGMATIAFNFSPWFFGEGYERVPYLLIMFSPLIVIIGLTNVIGTQYLLPMGRDKLYTRAICIGAIVNFILNMILIIPFWAYGACVATIVAEFVVMISMFSYTNKSFSCWAWIKSTWKNWISGLFMFVLLFPIQSKLASSILNTLIIVIAGILIYFWGLFILKDKYIHELITKLTAFRQQ